MVIYFLSAIFILLFGVLTNANKTQKRKKRFVLISFAILIIVAALRAPNVGLDLVGHYVKRYYDIGLYDWSSLPGFSTITGYEIGYCYFTKILTLVSSDVQFYLLVCAVIIYASNGYFIYKESDDVVMSTMLLIFTCTYYMCMTMMRQGLAFAFILVGFTKLDHSERQFADYVKFAMWILFATTFHDSAMLCLSMILIDRLKFTRKHIIYGFLALMALYMFYERMYTLLTGLIGFGENNYERYLSSLTEGTGSVNSVSIINVALPALCFLLGYYILVWKRKTIKTVRNVKENTYQLNKRESFMLFMVLIATICRVLIFRMNIINRFTYYFIPFLFILYPRTIAASSSINNRKILRLLVYIVFGLYFIWMTVDKAGALYGTVPYQFFWNY